METEMKEKKSGPAHHFDYKDIVRLRANMNAHARMLGRNRTSLTARGQRSLATAVKRARFMALVPYIKY